MQKGVSQTRDASSGSVLEFSGGCLFLKIQEAALAKDRSLSNKS
jgi:hypothetical protein